MPRRRPVPSLLECSALATCRLVMDAVRSEASLSELERKHKGRSKARVVKRIDRRCSAVAEFLKSKLPLQWLSDLANVYLHKLRSPADSPERLNKTVELMYAMCAFLKCGLLEVSFSELFPDASGGEIPEPIQECHREVMWQLLFKIMTTPAFFSKLKRLDLKGLKGRFPDVMRKSLDLLMGAIASYGTELVHLDLRCELTYSSTYSSFVPRKDNVGVFVGTVPCPKLETFKVYDWDGSSMVDVLLSHPLLSSWDFWHIRIFNDFCDRLLRAPQAFQAWKSESGLTHVRIVIRGRTMLHEAAVSHLDMFFPKVTNLEVVCESFNLRELTPLMSRLQHLKLDIRDEPRTGTQIQVAVDLLASRGRHLTTLKISMESIFSLTLSQLKAIDQGCPNLANLSLFPVVFTGPEPREPDDFRLFRNLKAVALGAFVNSGYQLAPGVSWNIVITAQICLKNKPLLEKFTLLIGRNNFLTDDFVLEWVSRGWAPNLREVSISCWDGSLPLTDSALAHLVTLPNISRIGELEFWSIEESTFLSRRKDLATANVDLELVWYTVMAFPERCSGSHTISR